MIAAPDPDKLTPVNVPMMVAVQLYVVPDMEAVGVKLNGDPLQISCMKDVGGSIMDGLGVTVTVTSIEFPGQLLAEGVIRYTTVPGFTPSELERI